MKNSCFNEKQYVISGISDQIKHLVESNFDKTRNDAGDIRGKFFTKEVMDEFATALQLLQVAKIYIQRIDHLVCGDEDDETFLFRLKNDLGKLNYENIN